MLSYQFSTREKILLFALALVVVAVAWYMLVFQNTSAQITSLNGQIADTQSTIAVESARAAQLSQMQSEIDRYKAQGATPVEMPAYDNMQPLMTELNSVMGMADTYTLSFDQLDTSGTYVKRGVSIDFGCGSYGAAVSIVNALAHGRFPCVVDSFAVVDGSSRSSRTAASTSASVHVTFFEKAQ